MLSLVVPVYRNEDSIPALVETLQHLSTDLNGAFEAVLVVDGSPDASAELLSMMLPAAGFRSRLLLLSRNFGSFAAVRAGLAAGEGDRFVVMSADLQEPPELVLEFERRLASGSCDVVVGVRESRSDPLVSRCAASVFWRLYRWLVQREVPRTGVDVFGCCRGFRDQLVSLPEVNSTLIGLVFWLGFRRQEVHYHRRRRTGGHSAWTFRRRLRYLLDSCFAFSDLPIRLMTAAGLAGILLATVLGIVVLVARLAGDIAVPGYTPIVLSVLFFGGLNSLGFGIIGEYLWRTFENGKGRPAYVVRQQARFDGMRGSP